MRTVKAAGKSATTKAVKADTSTKAAKAILKVAASDAFTLKDLQRITGKSDQTIWNWRQGKGVASKLPVKLVPKVKGGKAHAVVIPREAFLKWAQKVGVEVNVNAK